MPVTGYILTMVSVLPRSTCVFGINWIILQTCHGREYAGSSDYSPFPHAQLQCLVERALDSEEQICKHPPQDTKTLVPTKHKAAPTPPLPVPAPPLLRMPLTSMPATKNGSHLHCQKNKEAQSQALRQHTLVHSEALVQTCLLYGAHNLKAKSTGYCALTGDNTFVHTNLEGFWAAGYTVKTWNGKHYYTLHYMTK
jgi:hypothetical protein